MKTLLICALALSALVRPSGYLVPKCEWHMQRAQAQNASLSSGGAIVCTWVSPNAPPNPVFDLRPVIT